MGTTNEADADNDLVERLSTAACWQLLEQGELGRLAVDGVDGRPDVFPVNYLVHAGSLFIRTAPGSKLADIAAHPDAAFEVDGDGEAFRWSVVVRGSAHVVVNDDDIRESGVDSLSSWNPTRKDRFIRLTPVTVTGRRFRRRLPDVRSHAATGGADAASASGDQSPDADTRHTRPVPIPHFPPAREEPV